MKHAWLVVPLAIGAILGWWRHQRALPDAADSSDTLAPNLSRSSHPEHAPAPRPPVLPEDRRASRPELRGGVVRDPHAATYSAAQLYKAGGGTHAEIYASEPRNPAWADRREKEIAEYPRAEILQVDPDAKVEVDCRTSSCRVRIRSRNPQLVAQMGPFPFACMGASSAADLERRDPADPNAEFSDVYILFGEENLTDEAFLENREKTCGKYRDAWNKSTTLSGSAH